MSSFAPIPFRTAQKVKQLAQRQLIPQAPFYPLKPVPRYVAKEHRHQQYQHVHGLGSWMVDVAFFADGGQLIQASEDHPEMLEQEERQKRINRVLICIHCNSRYVHAVIIPNEQWTTIFDYGIKYITQLGFPCDTIISDADKSLASAVRRIPRLRHIVYNMSDPNNVQHSSLAIIDRFTRTLRDMLFTADISITPQTLAQLIHIYNNTPHTTLTKVMGFEVTPLDMISNPPLQEEYVRRIQAANISKSGALSHAFNIGDEVYVYQPRNPFLKRRNTALSC